MKLAACAVIVLCSSGLSAPSGDGASHLDAPKLTPKYVASDVAWYDGSQLTLEGKGWTDTPSLYSRLPRKADKIASAPVRNLSRNPAGLSLRFVTDSSTITAAWDSDSTYAMNHMALTGSAGLDLYRRQGKNWRYAGTGRPSGSATTATLTSSGPAGMAEYALYLPLYRDLKEVRLGVTAKATMAIPPPRKPGEDKPIVFYGTSITQGGCASRAGMCHVNILGRWLNRATIDLGFSGSGKSEPEMADLVAEIDAAVFVLEPLGNTTTEQATARLPYWLKRLRSVHPETPVVLVEDPLLPGDSPLNLAMKEVYKDAVAAGMKKLLIIKTEPQLAGEENGTVDGSHPTDLGFYRISKAYLPVLKQALEMSEKPQEKPRRPGPRG